MLGREAHFELPERARVVLHSLHHYRLGLLESRTYPHGTKLSALVTSPHRDRFRETDDRQETGVVDKLATEFDAVRKNGTTFPIEVLLRRIDFGGRPAILNQFRDLTQQKMQGTALWETEAKYRTLVESSIAGVTIIQNGRFKYVNQKFADMLGYTQQELLALPLSLDVVHEDDRAFVQEQSRRRLDGTVQTTYYIAAVCRKDGTVIDVEVNGSVMEYLGEKATMGTMLDVTERRRADRQLRESEKKFRTLFEESTIGIVMATTTDAQIQRVNAAFCEMLEYTEDELVGRSIVEITHPDDAAGTPDSAARVMEDAESVVRLNKRYRTKSGALVQAETTVSILRDDDGRPMYGVAMIQDVTEQRRLEEQLHEILRLESVEQLAGGVAHNFNNALTAISGYSELLARRFDAEDPALRELQQIQLVTEQAAQLTHQLLAFSGTEHQRPTVLCLNDPIESTRDLLSPLLGDELQIHLRLDRNLPNVSIDRSQIEQVITNLILNARDAMPDGGVLTIETNTVELDQSAVRTDPDANPGRYARLTVTDTGIGMDRDTVTRIFEPFFTTKEQGQGVGLGLAMVHGVVKQSGGFIVVDTEPLTGSTFSIHLPQAEALPRSPNTIDIVH